MAGENKIIRISPIRLGLNTTADDESRPADQCGDMSNWTRTRSGAIATRQGYQRLVDNSRASSKYTGMGLATYSYFDSDSNTTKEELIILGQDSPQRTTKETMAVSSTIVQEIRINHHPLAKIGQYIFYINDNQGNSIFEQMGTPFSGVVEVDLTDSWENGSTVSVADNAAWSIHLYLKNLDALPSGGNFFSLLGNTASASNHQRLDINSSGNLFLYDANNNGVSWTTGFAANDSARLTLVCDGTNSDNIELFVNNTSYGTVTLANSAMTLRYIGQKGDATQRANVKVRDFYFFTKALSTTEIASLVADTHVTSSLDYYTPIYGYPVGDGNSVVVTLATLKLWIDNHPDVSCTLTDSTIAAAYLPMQIGLFLDYNAATNITYWAKEDIPTGYHAI